MKATLLLPDQTYLRELFSYEVDSGILRWKERPESHFPPSGRKTSQHLQRIWNVKHAGSVAGHQEERGYIWINVAGRLVSAHRVIWKMHHDSDPEQIDHTDTDAANNRIGNLRPANNIQNNCNRLRQRNNTTGAKGVSFRKERGKYRARIRYAGKDHLLGYFDTIEEARAAYLTAGRINHGEFFNPG